MPDYMTEEDFHPPFIPLKWRRALYDLQAKLVPVVDEQEQINERGRWTQLPRWTEELTIEYDIKKVVDIGCGRGVLSALSRTLFPDAEVVAVDRDPNAVSEATLDEYKINFVCDDVEVMSEDIWHMLRDADVIILAETMQYWRWHMLSTLRKVISCLKPLGRLMISTPDSDSYGRIFTYREEPFTDILAPIGQYTGIDSDDALWYFSKDEVESLILTSGMKIDRFAFSSGIPGGRHLNFQVRNAGAPEAAWLAR